MKKYLFLIIPILFMSCFPITELKEKDIYKYVRTESFDFNNSPLAYNMLKGQNGFQKYSWKQVVISSYWFTYYSLDKAPLIMKLYSDADIIMSFSNSGKGSLDGTYFFIGYKNKE